MNSMLRAMVRAIRRVVGVRPGRDELEDEMGREMEFHLEMEARELESRGHAPEEARRLARVRFGGVDRYKEEGREARGRLADDTARDIGYAVRAVRRRPSFALAVVATLAVGIGSTTAVWSLVDAVVLKPLPFPEPDRIARIQVWFSGEKASLSPAEYGDYHRGGQDVFSAVGAYAPGSATVGGEGSEGAERVDAVMMSAGLFGVLGTEPLLGRPFTEDEEFSGARSVVLC